MKARRIVISTVLLVGGLLSIVQIMPKNPLLIGERLFPYGGWIQVILAMLYSGWLCHKMQDRQERLNGENERGCYSRSFSSGNSP